MSDTAGISSGYLTFWWPAQGYGANQSRTYDMTSYLDGDSIASMSLAIMPSGAGELQPADLSVTGNVFTAQFTGGVAGRTYTAACAVTGTTGRVWQVFGHMQVQIVAPGGWPPPPPSSPGYGAAIYWTGGTV